MVMATVGHSGPGELDSRRLEDARELPVGELRAIDELEDRLPRLDEPRADDAFEVAEPAESEDLASDELFPDDSDGSPDDRTLESPEGSLLLCCELEGLLAGEKLEDLGDERPLDPFSPLL